MRLRPSEQEILYDRFQRIHGASQQALAQAHVDLIGCGGLGGEVGHGLVRKGVGHLTLCDHDHVDASNLARQQFYAQDVGKPKALALARNLARQATGNTHIQGYATSFQEVRANGMKLEGDVAVVGVDNNATRIAAAEYYWARAVPVIFLAVDVQAARGYVFVQSSQPDEPCFQCLYPDAPSDQRIYGCAGASIEILKIMAGIALYAIDSLLMTRPRPWNYKAVFLDQGGDGQHVIGQRPACSLCSRMPVEQLAQHKIAQPERGHV
jgi:molybdopterin/thiamine biosynthesis adenylyltransferase